MRCFRREYKTDGGVKVQVIGSRSDRPKSCPYLRIERDGEYIGSLDGARLYHLRNALDYAIKKVPK